MNDELKNNQSGQMPDLSDLWKDFDRMLDEEIIDDEGNEVKKESHIEDLESLSPEEKEQLLKKLKQTKNDIDVYEWLSELTVEYNQLYNQTRHSYVPEEIKQRYEKRMLDIENYIRETCGEENKDFADKAIAHVRKYRETDEMSLDVRASIMSKQCEASRHK